MMKTTDKQRNYLRDEVNTPKYEIFPNVNWPVIISELLGDIDELIAENERLEAGWMEFESVSLDGKLRPSACGLLQALEDCRADNKKLREAIGAVEWVDVGDYGLACPWCWAYRDEQDDHFPDCQRQLALHGLSNKV